MVARKDGRCNFGSGVFSFSFFSGERECFYVAGGLGKGTLLVKGFSVGGNFKFVVQYRYGYMCMPMRCFGRDIKNKKKRHNA